MPFTISHVAAVLPFSRPLARWRLLSAAIIGCMVPDFGILMPWRPARIETHSVAALLTFCLPAGLATFWIFQQLIKTAFVEILPDAAYGRWRSSSKPADIGSPRQWLLAACGILVGAFSHLVWDAFTHEGGRGIRMIAVLDDPVLDIAGHRLMGAWLLQDVSSIVGLLVVLAVVVYGLRRDRGGSIAPARILSRAERTLWMAAFALTVSLLTGLFGIIRGPEAAGHSLAHMAGNLAIAVLRGCAASLVLISLGLTLRLRATPGGAARNDAI